MEKENIPFSLSDIPKDVLDELYAVGDMQLLSSLVLTSDSNKKQLMLWQAIYKTRFNFDPPYWFNNQLKMLEDTMEGGFEMSHSSNKYKINAYRNLYKWTEYAISANMIWEPLVTFFENNQDLPSYFGRVIYDSKPVSLMLQQAQSIGVEKLYTMPFQLKVKPDRIKWTMSNECPEGVVYNAVMDSDALFQQVSLDMSPIPNTREEDLWIKDLASGMAMQWSSGKGLIKLLKVPSFKSVMMYILHRCPIGIREPRKSNLFSQNWLNEGIYELFLLSLFFYQSSDFETLKDLYKMEQSEEEFLELVPFNLIFYYNSTNWFPTPPRKKQKRQTSTTRLRKMRNKV